MKLKLVKIPPLYLLWCIDELLWCCVYLSQIQFHTFWQSFGLLLLLVFKRLLGTREKTCVTDYLENSPMYVVNHCLLVFRWFLRSFEVPSRVAVEGERHYFMYASICYFCKNENRKKTFTSNTSEKPTWSRMIITGAKFKQGNFRTFSTLH